MAHLILGSTPLELYTWTDFDGDSKALGWDVLTDNPFAITLPGDQFSAPQNYFAEYHLEYHRQRFFTHFPSRLHSLLLFATCTDARNFADKYPERVAGKTLIRAQSSGDYVVSFHDASYLDYLRLPHDLGLDLLDEVSRYYWSGTISEESELQFMGEFWWEIPIIEAVFQGRLSASFKEPVLPALSFIPGQGRLIG